jgi:hypothetical protein
MRKIVIIILALVVALGALPITFACYSWGGNGWGWNDWNWCWQPEKTVYCCTTDCQLCFTDVQAYDNEETFAEYKDVGETEACVKCCDKLKVTVENAYPCYQGIVDFCLKNTGNMVATITSITSDYPDPNYLRIELTGDVEVGTVVQPCETKCGTLVIGGIPQQEDAQNRCFTFEITLNYTCSCVPQNCETAYAYYGGCYCGTNYAHCFLNNYLGHSFGNWGWTNGPLRPGCYNFPIYAGAAQCNLYKGEKVGYLTVSYNGSKAIITYYMYSGYKLDETHLYVGSAPWPENNGSYTVAPGQYPYWHDLNNASTDSYEITGLCGNIYIIAHAVVCGNGGYDGGYWNGGYDGGYWNGGYNNFR